jgi:hypothetical protein
MRALILLHRYLGIAIGVVMALWCASGFVMMYQGFPNLDDNERFRALQSVSWDKCCAFDKLAEQLGVDVIDSFSVEMLDGRPVLRVSMTRGRRAQFDLISGERADSISEAQALDVARRYAISQNLPATPRYQAAIEIDQWTVQMRRDRPLHQIALDDPQGTELYVSGKTGQLIQDTNTRERFWNWLGAVPHWLYPTVLRQNGELWTQVVVYLSLAGVFLTLMGLYIGVAHWLAAPTSRWSTYRGVNLWHHLSGLFFGVLTLTWVASGLVSMNPWGLFEGSGAGAERERARDMWIDGAQMTAALKALVAKNDTSLTRIASAPIAGTLYLLAYEGSNAKRLDAKLMTPAPIVQQQIEHIAQRIAEDDKFTIDFLTEGDSYYYSGHDPVDLPVYRVVLDNPDHTRYYLNPLTGEILGKIDAEGRWHRWLFEGFHRLDFTAALRTRPWWDLWVLPLLLGVTVGTFTGVWMGYKRLRR